jgi:hypothetical protein
VVFEDLGWCFVELREPGCGGAEYFLDCHPEPAISGTEFPEP